MFISCSEEEPTNKLAEYAKMFSGKNSKTWKLTGFFARRTGGQEVEFNLSTCAGDDRYTFYANAEKLFEVSNGTFSCVEDGDDPLLVSYTWSFNNANASLSMVFPHIFGYFFIPFTVKSVTEDEMELEIFVNQEGTESYALILESVDED
jgi:hypothetical protein